MIMTGIFFLLAFLLNLVFFGITVYGVVLGFQKIWYIGLAAMVFPFFGFVIGAAKWIFKKDILN